jgi:hypothetical protein
MATSRSHAAEHLLREIRSDSYRQQKKEPEISSRLLQLPSLRCTAPPCPPQAGSLRRVHLLQRLWGSGSKAAIPRQFAKLEFGAEREAANPKTIRERRIPLIQTSR